MEFYQQYNQPLLSGQIVPTTTPQLVLTLGAALLAAQIPLGLSGSIFGFAISNNDPTSNLFVACRNTVTGTNWWRKIPPNTSMDFTAGLGVLRGLYIVSDTGTPNAHLEIFG